MDAERQPSSHSPAAATFQEAAPPPAASAPSTVRSWPRRVQNSLVLLVGSLLIGLLTHTLLFGSIQRPASGVAEMPLVRFDLNRATHAELRHLPGVGEKMADRIETYRRDQGPFQSVDELRKVPGIGPLTLERLRPWLFVEPGSLQSTSRAAAALVASSPPKAVATSAVGAAEASLSDPIDLNAATVAELQKLPGIGPKLSQRIVDARAQGAFQTVDGLRRVPGIGPKTLAKVRPYVVVGTNTVTMP